MAHYIFSTLSCSQHYGEYIKGGADLPIRGKQVLVKGGANVADKMFVTPRGVVTTVSDEELAIIERDPMFQAHKENGYITVEKKNLDIDKVVSNLTARDESAPLGIGDFAENKEPTTGKK